MLSFYYLLKLYRNSLLLCFMQAFYLFLYYLHYCLCIKVPLWHLRLKYPKVCSILFSSGENGGIVNTTHPNFFINNFTFLVLWMLALSNITTILLSYVIFASLDITDLLVDLEVEMRFGGDEIGGDSRFFRFSRLQK